MRKGKGFCEACILLPDSNKTDLSKWAVVACDQFTSQEGYWKNLKEFVSDAPSALNLIFPEVYLDRGKDAGIIDGIEKTCKKYLQSDFLKLHEVTYIFVERTTAHGAKRTGIVGRIDLEDYSYVAQDNADVRATEATILSRIPPRVRIRERAALELPHIMVLIDDSDDTVMKAARAGLGAKLYDFELNMGGGHITGHKVSDTKSVNSALDRLSTRETFMSKYGREDAMTYAVGDGNHSLATAKQHWENLKAKLSPEELNGHPARFALVEVVNLYDKGLEFEPIHRVVFDVDTDRFIHDFSAKFKGCGGTTMLFAGGREISVDIPSGAIDAVKEVDAFLSAYPKVDYIHGIDNLREVASRPHSVGVALPKMEKSQLFGYVIDNGALPKKTFSMGEAEEKRYYVEARRIVK